MSLVHLLLALGVLFNGLVLATDLDADFGWVAVVAAAAAVLLSFADRDRRVG